MEGKQLDFNAPFISVRRFGAAPPPTPPPSSSSASAVTAATSRAEVCKGGVSRERLRRSSLPFYKSELKSGPVRNPGVVPFVWEQSPGRPKDGSVVGDSSARPAQPPPAVAPKPPPGKIPRRPPDEKGETVSTDASNSANNSASVRRSSPISSSTSMHTSTASPTTAPTTTSSSSAGNGTSSKTLRSSREETKGKALTKPMVEPAAETPIFKEQRSVNNEGDEEEDAFSDALDTFSRTESFFMNCSISGMTGGTEGWEHSGRFSTDPQVRDFMMGRFLPAAQAMATESPQCAPRKPAAAASSAPPRRVLGIGGELRRPAAPLPLQQRPSFVSAYPRITHELDVGNGEDSSDDGDYDDGDRLPMKGCGLLSRFCLKGSFCLLNPVPGMKARGRMPLPAARTRSSQVRRSHHGPLDDEQTWEEVYKYKLRRERQAMGEEGSKLTSESNQLSYSSDSQTPDGSSPYKRSTAGGISPYRNEMPPSPFHEGKAFLGVPKCENRTSEGYASSEPCGKDDGDYWEISPHLNSKKSSGPVSPVVEKTVYVDSVQVLENCDSIVASLDIKSVANCMDKNSEIGWESQRIETSLVLGVCKDNALQHKVSEVVDAKEPPCSLDLSSPLEQRDNTANSRQNHVFDGQQPLEADDQGKNDSGSFQPLLPPPLPKAPSESWLWRTLPSISSKNPAPQSFFGFQLQMKKQVTQTTRTDPKWEAMVKTSVLKKGQVRFADALIKPANVD